MRVRRGKVQVKIVNLKTWIYQFCEFLFSPFLTITLDVDRWPLLSATKIRGGVLGAYAAPRNMFREAVRALLSRKDSLGSQSKNLDFILDPAYNEADPFNTALDRYNLPRFSRSNRP